MLRAVRGFNYGRDGVRVEPGTVLEDDFAPKRVLNALLSRGAVEPVTEATPPADAPTDDQPSSTTPDASQGVTEAHSGEEDVE